MQNTFLIQLRNEKAFSLLQKLEELDLIKLLPSKKKITKKSLSINKYAGILSKEEAEKMQEQIRKDREEWG